MELFVFFLCSIFGFFTMHCAEMSNQHGGMQLLSETVGYAVPLNSNSNAEGFSHKFSQQTCSKWIARSLRRNHLSIRELAQAIATCKWKQLTAEFIFFCNKSFKNSEAMRRSEHLKKQDFSGLTGTFGTHILLSVVSIFRAADTYNAMLPPSRENKTKRQVKNYAEFTTRDSEDKGVFFRDGRRRIDFILSYIIEPQQNEVNREAAKWRSTFHDNLLKEGLHLEIEICNDPAGGKGKIAFVKVYATWTALCKYAAILQVRKPVEYFGETRESKAIKEVIDKEANFCCSSSTWLSYDKAAIPDQTDYFSAPFSLPYGKVFRVGERETFFTVSQRSRIVWYILSNIRFDQGHLNVGIPRLLAKKAYSAAYPLHDGPARTLNPKIRTGDLKKDSEEQKPHDRYLLYKHWASYSNIFRMQPIDLIREYYGERIGIYFAWIGDYTKFLYYLTFIGLTVFIYGAVSATTDERVTNVCDVNKLGCAIMCPLCSEGCSFWELQSACASAIYSHLCDNVSTIAYAICITVWGTVFMEAWTRRETVLRYEWDIFDYESKEPPRPEFEVRATSTRMDPISGEQEPHEPFSTRLFRGLVSWTLVAVLIAVVLGTMISVIIYRTVLNATLFNSEKSEFLEKYGRILISISASTINLIVIIILTWVYERLAFKLTEWQNPRTQTEFDDSFTMKMFIFQFVNCYGTIFYTAFFRGRFHSIKEENTLPPGLKTFVGYISDQCDPAGCMADLSIQLAVVMIGRQLVSHVSEIAIPFLLKRRHKLRGLFNRRKYDEDKDNPLNKALASNSIKPVTASENTKIPRWEADFYLVDYTQSGVVHEYLEMALQFGFVCLFGVCFPLSPLFALINNMLEIRMDAYKLITSYRRPVSTMDWGIGIWGDILKCLLWMSILSNALIIAFTSENVYMIAYDLALSKQYYNTSMGWTVLPPNLNEDEFKPTSFSFMMSVASSNASSYMKEAMAKFKLEEECSAKSGFGDSSHYGGFALQDLQSVLKNKTLEYCYYRGSFKAPWDNNAYDYTSLYWQLMTIRLGFALTFIVVVWILSWLIAAAIPNQPKRILLLQRYSETLHEKALLRAHDTDEDSSDDEVVAYDDNDSGKMRSKNKKKAECKQDGHFTDIPMC